jgi:hypothetical protein
LNAALQLVIGNIQIERVGDGSFPLVHQRGHNHRRAGVRQALGERAGGIGRWKLWAKGLNRGCSRLLKVGEPGHGGKALTRGDSRVASAQHQACYRNVIKPVPKQVLQWIPLLNRAHCQ